MISYNFQNTCILITWRHLIEEIKYLNNKQMDLIKT